jgi:hypothetical protein
VTRIATGVDDRRFRLTWRAFLVIVAVIVVLDAWLIWLADAYLHVGTILNADFETYWAGARRLFDGQPLYAAAQLSGPYVAGDMDYGSGYVYPPTAAALSLPLAPLPVDIGWAVFDGLALAGLAAATFLIARREGFSRPASAVVAALIVSSGPIAQAAFAGNVNLWLGLGLAVAWLWPRSAAWFAVVGGLIKLYPGIAILWTIRQRVWSWTPIAVGAAFGAVVLIVWGSGLWTEFAATLGNARPFGAAFPQPPRSVLDPIVGPGPASVAAYAITAALGAGVLLVRGDRLAFFLLSLAMIMPALDWHTHYFLIPVIGALPGALHLIARPSRPGRTPSPELAPGAATSP